MINKIIGSWFSWITLILARWNSWSEQSANRRIFSSILTVSTFTAVVKLINVSKEVFVAAKFGTTDDMDAYLIAIMLPTFGIGLVSNSFNASLIPTFIHVREKDGAKAAQELFSGAMFFCVFLLLAITVLMGLSIPAFLPLFAHNFSSEKIILTRNLFYIFLPLLVISGFSTTWSAVINSSERFLVTALAPVMRPVAIILPLLLFRESISINVLAACTTAGFALELVFLGQRLRRQGFSLFPRWYGMTSHLRQVIGQYVPMIAGTFFMSSTKIVDQSMAAMLPAGSVSVLNYGGKVIGLILELTATALGTAVIPHVSRMVAQKEIKNLLHTYKTYQRLILLGSIPVVVSIILLSDKIITLLFNRGNFSIGDVNSVSQVQSIMSLQIPFYMLSILAIRIVSSFQESKILMYCAIFNAVINVLLNYVFMRYFGVAGIALSTVFVYIFTYLFIWFMLKRIVKDYFNN